MGIRPTQLASYLELIPKLNKKYQRILEVLHQVGHDLNAGEMYMFHNPNNRLGASVNCINARITEMLSKGLLREVTVRRNPTAGGLSMRTVEPTWSETITDAKPASVGCRKYYVMTSFCPLKIEGPMKKEETAAFDGLVIRRGADGKLEEDKQ